MPSTMNRNGPTNDLVFLNNGCVREHGIHLALGVILILGVLLGGMLAMDAQARGAHRQAVIWLLKRASSRALTFR